MNKSEYIKRTIQTRLIANRHIKATERAVITVLENTYQELTSLLELTKTDSLTYANYYSKRKAIGDLIIQMTSEIQGVTIAQMKGASKDMVNFYSDLAGQYAGQYNYNIGAAFATVNRAALENVVSRLWPDGQNFSSRIWNIKSHAEYGINDIIAQGIARGTSAVAMAKEFQQFLVNPEITPGVSYTTAGFKSSTGRGTINYQALRLAKTEVNNIYRETQIMNNEANPITLGVQWNLGSGHKIPDICDLWATQDLYGLGAGIYPADKTPIDHPNGFCYLTDVLRPVADWNKPKMSPTIQMTAWEAVQIIPEENQSAVEKIFKDVMGML